MPLHLESDVRSYCRSFPVRFKTATGSVITDVDDQDYLDFLAGCGSLNYGHNHPVLREALLDYIAKDGISMSLDMYTDSKDAFLAAFSRYILAPRELNYRMQFCGPTGANAVEAAIKLARKVTGRSNVIAFTNGFHGCTLGALALTGNRHHRSSSAPMLTNVSRFPYDGYASKGLGTAELLDQMLSDPSSGCDAPAAIILEPVQGEGGLNAATPQWAKAVERIARKHGALLIIDEIQSGCGRTGSFFAFESLGIAPDIITMAKSISGYGLPMSLLLMKPEIDLWEPAEHNGTFRGNNLAFVTGTAALEHFWSDTQFTTTVQEKIAFLGTRLSEIASRFGLRTKGRGFMQGIDLEAGNLCTDVRRLCFQEKLIIEACGSHDEVLKFLAPLTTTLTQLEDGLDIVERSIAMALPKRTKIEGKTCVSLIS